MAVPLVNKSKSDLIALGTGSAHRDGLALNRIIFEWSNHQRLKF